ncbi:TonB-dependent receptor [Phenylobacterium sp. J426]|uniref:TonB-dependent receptor plug domain-containing protein n=1 Tax=Phenylobacterium sp. J426 TaxID=2898439 RepID=UPI0021517FB7|nr:TonB-dependent receptor [Phenylobacterium sp. J426]MCR5875833.1 TonB-dependent receptor [Phenylobacterium sp. J426]
MKYRHMLFAAASAATLWSGAAYAQTPGADVEEVVVTGTRTEGRTRLQSLAPVDVVNQEALTRAGVTEVNQALSVTLPSYNFPRPGLADGTDTVRPATLRGLAPDQTLVLVNSKRRHSASLVNVNGTVGRGSSAVDLNTVPSAIVQSIEVLRDGASAQYGSDAIAGVLNLRLREASSGGAINATYGARVTTVSTLVGPTPAGAAWTVADKAKYDRTDGETINLNAWVGLPLGADGFLTVAGEYLDQKKTIRTAPDWRQQYPLVNGAFDPREATINRYNAWYGEPEIEQYTLFANAGYDLSEDAGLYGWASYQSRDSVSAGFFRRALDDRNVIQIYPDGFLPLINPKVTDFSAAGGATWTLAGWDMDTSVVYGSNKMDFTIRDTLNRSIGPTSKTVFAAGGFKYDQLVFNTSAVRQFDVGLASALNVAAGVEVRREGYEIFAGEPDSYRNGGVLLNGQPTPSGAQVFPGFRPSNEVDKHRHSVGAYLDLEANITDRLVASAAVRAEDYSDFGSTVTGKLAARFELTDALAIRGSIQNGFRAPSLQQQYFTATSTNFINGVPFDITTFPATDPVAAALGARPLDAEKSVNYAIGAVLRTGSFSLTVDAYRIEVEDRIVLSENLTQTNVRAYLTSQGFVGIGGGRFFINGVDTTTKGVDIVANYKLRTDAAGEFNFTAAANFNSTKVTKVPTTAQLSALNPAPVLFDRVNVLTFEEGTPDSKLSGSVDWQLGPFGATVRATRYGEVLSPGTSAALDLTLDAATLVDLEARWNVTEQVRLTLGADNVFDEYPTKSPPSLNSTSNTPFSNYSPFGRSGRYVYGRVAYSW